MIEMVLMIVWTIVSAGGFDLPVAVSQTSAIVPAATCAMAEKIPGSVIKLPSQNKGNVAVTVKCIPIK